MEIAVKSLVLALLIVPLAACTVSSDRAAMRDDPSKGIICTYEVPTGSALRERKCTTPEEREAQRQQSQHQVVLEPAAGNAR
jgi:hypothetical protein